MLINQLLKSLLSHLQLNIVIFHVLGFFHLVFDYLSLLDFDETVKVAVFIVEIVRVLLYFLAKEANRVFEDFFQLSVLLVDLA
jgi:hypothetical protein